MKKHRGPFPKDEELEAAVQRAIEKGIPLSTICREAEVDQSTLWKWRNMKSSPNMANRTAVLSAIEALLGAS